MSLGAVRLFQKKALVQCGGKGAPPVVRKGVSKRTEYALAPKPPTPFDPPKMRYICGTSINILKTPPLHQLGPELKYNLFEVMVRCTINAMRVWIS